MVDIEEIVEYLEKAEEALASRDLDDDEKEQLLSELEGTIELLKDSLQLPGEADMRSSITDLLASARLCYDRTKG